DTMSNVEGDDIARAGRCPANGVVTGTGDTGRTPVVINTDGDAVRSVGQRGDPVGSDAEEIALNDVPAGKPRDQDPMSAVPGDDVTGPGRRATDLGGNSTAEDDSVFGVAKVACPRHVGSDQVALNVRVLRFDKDTGPVVRNDVAFTWPGSANVVAAGQAGGHR